MRKIRRSPSSAAGFRGSQNLIVLLLAVLLVLTAADFILDHVSGKPAASPASSPAQRLEESSGAQANTPVKAEPIAVGKSTAAAPPLQKPAAVPPELTGEMPQPTDVHLQIFNGCGVPGLAGRVRAVLRDRGFDVLTFGNAQAIDYAKTLVIARTDQPSSHLAAQLIANVLGIPADQILIQPDPNLVDTDVTLIIGQDYRILDLTPDLALE